MKRNLTASLLQEFETIREEYLTIPDEEERGRLILRICEDLSKRYEDAVAVNFVDIVKYCIIEKRADLDSLIRGLKMRDDLDKQTIEREKRDAFDERFGTVTSLIIPQYELPEMISLHRLQTSGRYHPSPISSVIMALNALQNYNVAYNEFVFIDLGSGLGRNLLLASNYPFKKNVGIEHSQYLHNIAEMNVKRYLYGTKKLNIFDLQCIDVLDYSFPQENMVLYIWRPFSDEIAIQFIKKLEAFISNTTLKVVLIFLGDVYPIVEESVFFNILDKFFTTDVSFSEEQLFTITIYSNGYV
jgi:hypothetical protein